MSPTEPKLRAALLILALLLPALAAADEEEQPPAEGEQQAESVLREKVTVSVENEGLALGPRGASTSIIDPTESEALPSTLTEMVTELPSVAENGQGGLFQVVSIRGVSRQRVTSLIGGMRLSSDRRAGVSVSFVDPFLMGRIRVLRGPATTYYGSGALGGIMQVTPRTFDATRFEGGYAGNGNERYAALGLGGGPLSVGLAYRAADDASAADGTRLNTSFSQLSALLQGSWEKGGWSYGLVVIPSYAEDIGKSNSDFPERTTTYPRERHGLAEFTVTAPSGWQLQTYVHAQDLQTDVLEQELSRSRVDTESFDFGARWDKEQPLGDDLSIRYGVESFNRRGVNAVEVDEGLASGLPGEPTYQQSLDDARLDELGAYAALTWAWGPTSWQAGGRHSWTRQQNGDAPNSSLTAWNGFAGVTWPLAERLELRANIDSGLRFPNLGELFYTGTTGRGQVIGNPDLESERSRNAELSLRWLGRGLLVNGVLFHNRISNYIERVEIETDVLSWVNLVSGTLRGAELQAVYLAGEHWRLFGSGYVVDGRADDDTPLADVPPYEIRFGSRGERGRWSYDAGLAYRGAKSDPGPGENPIDAVWLLGAAVAYSPAPRWKISLSGRNLLDEEYFPSADAKAALAAGRGIALRLAWTGN